MTILLNITDAERLAAFQAILGRDIPDLAIVTTQDDYNPKNIRFLLTWQPLDDWSALPNLEVVFSISAGVDQFTSLPSHIALVRMVDPNNTQGVVEYVLAACLACLRGFPLFADMQRSQQWQPKHAATVGDTHVAILGLGVIGQAAAQMLASVGFSVSGWSRSPKQIKGVNCIAGKDAYASIIGDADIVVCLLPLTDETRGILSRPLFEQMKPGASLVHAGRGAHCILADLSDYLESGHIGSAVLDVFETEPLPTNDTAWDLPRCLITPHIAGRTNAQTAAQNVARNLIRWRKGQDLLWQVDQQKNY